MSDRLRSAINNAVKVLVTGVLFILLNVLADVTNWVNGGEVPDVSNYTKGVVVLVLAAGTAVVSAVIDWLKGFTWFPGVAPTYVKPPAEG
jgi:hypothetical protein